MTMPGDITFNSGTSYFGQNLTDFVLNGTIAASRVDDMATRILASWYLLKQDSDYPAGMSMTLKLLSCLTFAQSTSTRSSHLTSPQMNMLMSKTITSKSSERSAQLVPFS